jgi:hypothetical protein
VFFGICLKIGLYQNNSWRAWLLAASCFRHASPAYVTTKKKEMKKVASISIFLVAFLCYVQAALG